MQSPARMNGVDTLFVRSETDTLHAHIIQVLMFNESAPIQRSQLLHRLRPIVQRHPRLRCRVVTPLPTFGHARIVEEDKVDLDSHLISADVRIAALHEFVTSVINTPLPLDDGRSPWRMYLCTDSIAHQYAVIFQCHHAFFDGHSIHALNSELLDPLPPSHSMKLPGTASSGPVTSDWLPILRNAATSLLGLNIVSHILLPRANVVDPAVAEQRLGQEKHYACTNAMSAKTIAALTNHFRRTVAGLAGLTMNDVLLAILSGAMRRAMEAAAPALPQTADRLTVLVPADLHPASEDITATQRHELDDTFGNRSGIMFVDLQFGLTTREERLRQVANATSLAKVSREAAINRYYFELAGLFPTAATVAMTPIFTKNITAAFTSMIFSKVPRRLLGQTVSGWRLIIPQPGVGPLGICIATYHDDVVLCITADKAVVPNLQGICRCLDDEYADFCMVIKSRL